MKRNQKAFTLVEIVIVIVILGIAGGLGWAAFHRVKKVESNDNTQPVAKSEKSSPKQSTSYVDWQFNGTTWGANTTPPACADPFTVKSPMDVTKATSLLYPGQVRGGDFKPHGGLGSEGAAGNNISVYAVTDAYLYRGARYIEGGVVQYMFDFIHPCGFMYRLDHLATLSDEFKQYANQLPEPKKDDSRTTKYNSQTLIKQGTLVATQVGNVNTKNAFFDFGLYDLRQPNQASKTAKYATDQLRISDKEQSFFSVCWFDYLSGSEKTTIKGLPARGLEGKTSDYCN